MKAKLTAGGRVTLPKACRDKLGLKTGTVQDFEVVDGVLIARKVHSVTFSVSGGAAAPCQWRR